MCFKFLNVIIWIGLVHRSVAKLNNIYKKKKIEKYNLWNVWFRFNDSNRDREEHCEILTWNRKISTWYRNDKSLISFSYPINQLYLNDYTVCLCPFTWYASFCMPYSEETWHVCIHLFILIIFSLSLYIQMHQVENLQLK